MKFRALALGATIGFLAAVVPSCGKATSCGPSNCTGCCSSAGTCVTGTNGNNTTCGTSGNTCQDCTKTNQACTSSFTCGGAGGAGGGTGTGGGSGGGATGNCNATTCANGCCAGTVCIPTTAQSRTNCGTAGQTCMVCPASNVCGQGMCRFQDAGQPSVTGEACADDTACTSLGAGSVCKKTTTLGGGTYSGGYCSKQPCTQTATCADDAICVNIPPTLGETAPSCLKKCSVTNGGCRTGYRCFGLQSGGDQGVCYLDDAFLPMNVDAGPPADKVGNSCTANTQCQNPPNPPFANLGFCQPEFLPDGGNTGFPGGYCSADCSDFVNLCGANAVCLAVDMNNAFCFSSCSAPGAGQSNCRNGYVCDRLVRSDGGQLPNGACNPSCFAPGNACGQGTYCDGGYCVQ